jgi:hypothetical protein
MDKNVLYNLKGITPEEFSFLEQVMNSMTEQEQQQFVMFYSGKRQSAGDILLFTLLGLIVVAGVHRFIMGQIGMGILYFFTGGLCLIGTIVDALNHKNLAAEHNQKMALECVQLVKMKIS